MQNFTFGRKGLNWFLFAFILFVGNLSASYAQCPTLTSTSDDFCYLDRVSALDAYATDEGDGIVWFRTATSNTPIPDDEILQDGSYFAGNESGDCDSRPEFTVSVSNVGAPTSTFGNFYEPCVYSGSDDTTVGDLKLLIETTDPTYDINVYAEEFGDASDELADATPLVAGENYFIGQNDPAGDCEYSSRIAIEYSPVEAFAPTADALQEFCESDDPTVADLMASSSNPDNTAFRWYSTMNSQPALSNSTPLQDGTTYYVSQIVNRTDSTQPPCESTERTAVEVNIIPSDAGPDNTDGTLCVSAADDVFASTDNLEDFFFTLLVNNFDSDPDNDVPTDGTFSDEDLATLVAAYSGPGYYETTYTATFDATAGCEDDVVLAVTVVEDPDAGTSTDLTYCRSDFETLIAEIAADPDSAADTFSDLISGADAGGTFSPSLETLATAYLADVAADDFPATYVTNYTVTSGTIADPACSDTSTLTLNILPDPEAGTDASETLCENEVEDSGIFASDDSLEAYFLDLLGTTDDRGTFSPSLSDLRAAYDGGLTSPSEDFTTEYTVDTGACAPESATATLTVTVAIPAEAGTGTDMSYCSNDPVVDLSTLLSGENPDGEFSSTDADVSDGTFNPALGMGTYSITYTVSPDTACVTDTDTETFTITIEDAPEAGSDATATFCETDADVMTIFADESSLETYLLDLLSTTDDSGDFNPSLATLIANYDDGIDGAEDFSTTYTIAATAICDAAESTATITINEAVPAEAGTIGDVDDVCSNDTEIELSDYLTDPATILGSESISTNSS